MDACMKRIRKRLSVHISPPILPYCTLDNISLKTENGTGVSMNMQKYFVKTVCLAVVCGVILAGCAGSQRESDNRAIVRNDSTGAAVSAKDETVPAAMSEPEPPQETEQETGGGPAAAAPEPEITEADWSRYFNGLNGAAVVYDADAARYTIYDRERALTRRSPCSTFKIVSSLIALENGIIDPDDAVRTWSGETFWNENWNHDIGFMEAFRVSCVWYFREVANEIGQERMQRELDRLAYGNCDISDWEGRRNTNNQNRALTGFWIELSLLISPKEQAEVMARIFGEDTVYAEETRTALKQAMLVTEENTVDIPVYGKTGMGKAQGVVVDAWYTGFAEREEGNLYFCVYLGRTDGKDVSSAAAKEIALQIMADWR